MSVILSFFHSSFPKDFLFQIALHVTPVYQPATNLLLIFSRSTFDCWFNLKKKFRCRYYFNSNGCESWNIFTFIAIVSSVHTWLKLIIEFAAFVGLSFSSWTKFHTKFVYLYAKFLQKNFFPSSSSFSWLSGWRFLNIRVLVYLFIFRLILTFVAVFFLIVLNIDAKDLWRLPSLCIVANLEFGVGDGFKMGGRCKTRILFVLIMEERRPPQAKRFVISKFFPYSQLLGGKSALLY